MKSKMMLSLMPVFLAVFVMVGAKDAKAVDVGVGINLGGSSHYHRGGTVVEYRTADPVYTTWYPETSSSYVYTPSTYYTTPTYYDNGYGYSTPSTYIYSTNNSGYNGWYGSGRSGHGGYYGGGSRGGSRDGGHRR